MDSKYTDYLDTTIKDDLKPVTYKSLARAFKIHANTAKQILYEYSKDKNDLFVMYCITGSKNTPNQFNIKLTKSTHLEVTKREFKQITGVHVYSISNHELNDFGELTKVCAAYKLSLDERLECGITKKESVRVLSTKEAVLEQKEGASQTKTSNDIKVKPVPGNQSKSIPAPHAQPATATITTNAFMGKRKATDIDDQPNKKANTGLKNTEQKKETNPFSDKKTTSTPVKNDTKPKPKKGKPAQKSITSFFKK